MKKLLLTIAFFSSQIFADTFMVKLSKEQKDLAKKDGYALSKLAPFSKSDFFQNVYTIKLEEKKLDSFIQKFKPELIEKDGTVESFALTKGDRVSSDFLSSYQYYLEFSGQKILKDITDITSKTIEGNKDSSINSINIQTDKELVVAVIDTGVDRTHPELKDKIFKNLKECDEEGNVIPLPQKDKDENGLVGDCQGWDFAGNKRFAHIVNDKVGHGTHISGIIAAENNNEGIKGVSPNVKILPIQVFHPDSKSPFTFISTVTKALLYAVEMKADIVNLSLGWPYTLTPNTFNQALRFAKSKGLTIISSSGNDNNNRFIAPCALDGIICVAANSIDSKKATFSNYGMHVDFMAPGDEILSTYPVALTPNHFSIEGYEILSGTSQATPMVTGAISLLKTSFDKISDDEIFARLALSSSSKGRAQSDIANGIIDVKQALEVKPQPLIRPVLKNVQEILVFEDKILSLNLRLKNYWIKAQDVKVTVEVKRDDIVLEKSLFELKEIGQGKNVRIPIKALINKLDSKNLVNLSYKIEAKDMLPYKRVHNIEILSTLSDEKIASSSTNLDMAPKDILFYKGPELLTKVRTVPNFLKQEIKKAYWVENKKGLTLISMEDNQLKPKPIVIENFKQVLSIEERDFTYDGKDNILVRYVSNTDKRYIGYLYLSLKGKTIAHFKYFPEASVYSTGNGGFLKHKLGKGFIALPIWAAIGNTPSKDLSLDPWAPKPKKASHIYFLEIDKDQSENLVIRIADNDKFLKELGLKNDSYREVRQLKTQSHDEYLDNKIQFTLASKDNISDFLVQDILMTGKNIQSKEVSHLQDYQFYGLLTPHFDQGDKDFLLSNSQNDNIIMLTDSKTANNYVLKSKEKKLLNILGAFSVNNELLSVIESKSSIELFHKSKSIDSISLNRVSFLGNTAFKSSFIPLSGPEGMPLLYQDSTFLGNRKVSLISINSEGFINNIDMNFKIPGNCSTLNPLQSETGEVFLHLICDLKGKAQITKIKMSKN